MRFPMWRRPRLISIQVLNSLLLCCMVLLFAACSNTLLARVPASTLTSRPTPSSLATLPAPKADSNSYISEEATRNQLEKVKQLIDGMTLDQKLGQLIIVEYLGNNYEASGLQEMISQQFVGGFMYQESNSNFDPPYNVASNLAAFSQQAQSDARIPLLIATDQEGGLVNRLYTFHGYLPSAAEMAATGNPNMALQQGAQAAQWMRQLGMNADLAPIVDVQTVSPPVLETRMFGSDPLTVATYAGAFLNGLQENAVAGTLKHFPGLGAITSDPHDGLPVVNRSLSQLESIDLEPYKLMIGKDNPAMIMSTDVLMPAIDPNLPAELSPKAITGILRDQLGYTGVVITDGLYMQGISDTWTLPQAAVLSIVAGDDLVEGPYTPAQVASVIVAFKQALQDGQLTIDRIDQSVERILLLKMQYGIIH
jgi:beta-N-acetylhexosaminidase